MDDTISRQAAIEAIKEDKIDLTNPNVVAVFKATGDFEKVETQAMTCDRHIKILKELPSAQPEHLTDDDFETIRIHLSAFKERLCNQHRWKEAEDYERLIGRFISFASAQTEVKPIDYQDCANAMLKMWMDNIITDGEYNRIMDKLNAHWRKKNG